MIRILAPRGGMRAYLYWMGPLLGMAVAALWAEATVPWLLGGALLGYASELAATWLGARERTPLERALAAGLVALTLLSLLPFLVLGGVLPSRRWAPETVEAWRLALLPLGVALIGALRYAQARRCADEQPPAPAGRVPVSADARRWLWTFGALLTVALIGLADYHLPVPFSLDFLYLVPVFAVTWATGRWGGVLLAVFSAEVRGISRGLSFAGELSPLLSAMDSLLIAAGLGCEAFLLAALRAGLQRERAAARTDLLTGLMNRKDFMERLELEVSRASRHTRPLSIAYLDLDGFKGVNDQHGHAAGDEVLRIVAGVLRTSVRREDATARFGGDEFAVLLPDTDPETAMRVMQRLHREVEDRMVAFGWPVTCSVGVVTDVVSGVSVDELVRHADELMYEVKHGGKNALRQAVLSA